MKIIAHCQKCNRPEYHTITPTGPVCVRCRSNRRARLNRQARHEAMTSCCPVRVRVNGKVFYE